MIQYNQLNTKVFSVVKEMRISSKSAKSCKIHRNTQNTAEFTRNSAKYMSSILYDSLGKVYLI